MQLMTFNSLLMFDIVFVFFLFLVGVTCLVYYLPPTQSRTSAASSTQASAVAASTRPTTAAGGADVTGNLSYPGDSHSHFGHHLHHHHHHNSNNNSNNHHQTNLHHNNSNDISNYACERQHPGYELTGAQTARRYVLSQATEDLADCRRGAGAGSPQLLLMMSQAAMHLQRHNRLSHDDVEEPGNMEILPENESSTGSSSTLRKTMEAAPSSAAINRHLYHNILNAAFELQGEGPCECDVLRQNEGRLGVSFVAPTLTPTSPQSSPTSIVSTSLPSSPTRTSMSPCRTTKDISGAAAEQDRQQPMYHSQLKADHHRILLPMCPYHHHHQQQHIRHLHSNCNHQCHASHQQIPLAHHLNPQSQPRLIPHQLINGSADLIAAAPAPQKPGTQQHVVVDMERSTKRVVGGGGAGDKYCYVKAKNCDIKKCSGPVDDV